MFWLINNRLKEVRMKEYMMKPQEFARYIDVNCKTYYSWEQGIVNPSLQTALNVAKKLNKKVEDIWYI
ncbi:helix-turn-helix transcriptional regulator [Clostridium tertium]|uniref:helix-turn-helix transcriptional regulator n=1 Tax=Clostridium tertium TaxID=1559 RepID=UPI00311B0AB1